MGEFEGKLLQIPLPICYIVKGGIKMRVIFTKHNHNAVSLLLNVTRDEYNSEHIRTTTIDNKTNISLPIIAAYFLTLAQFTDYKTLFNISIISYLDLIKPTIYLLIYIMSLALAFLSCIKMIQVIFTKPYAVINPADLYNSKYMYNDSSVLSIELIRLYIKATAENKNQNNARIREYKKGWIYAVISISLFVLYNFTK